MGSPRVKDKGTSVDIIVDSFHLVGTHWLGPATMRRAQPAMDLLNRYGQAFSMSDRTVSRGVPVT